MANGNFVGVTLARYIRERAYLAGTIPRHEKEIAALLDQLAAAKARRDGLIQRLAELDVLICEQAPNIDPAEIRVIRPTPRQLPRGGHGKIIATIIDLLQNAPEGLTTNDILETMAPMFGMKMATAPERHESRDRVLRPLNKLRAEGAVLRLTSEVLEKGQPVARWLWVGL